jgi:O-antigen/teichoic acid export membrane protein
MTAQDAGASSPPARTHLGWAAISVALAQIGTIAAAAITSVIIARKLGPHGTGVFALIGSFVDVIVMVVGLGLAQGITYTVSHGQWSVRTALRHSLLAATVLGAIGVGLGVIVFELIGGTILRGATRQMTDVALIAVPTALAGSFWAVIVLAAGRYNTYSAFTFAQAAANCVGIGVLVIAFGLIGAVSGYAAAYLLVAVVTGVWVWRRADDLQRSADASTGHAAEPAGLRTGVHFGLKTWAGNLLQYVNYRLDLFLVSAFATSADVGVYSVAVSLTALGWILPDALHTVLFPRTASIASAAAGAAGRKEAEDAIMRASRHSILLVLPTALVLVVLLVVVVPILYGSKFAQTVTLGLLLLPGVLALGWAKILSAATTGLGFPEYALWTAAIVAPITVVLYLALVPPLGATGAALSSTASYLLTTVFSAYYLKRATGMSLRAMTTPSRADVQDYVDMFRGTRAARYLAARKVRTEDH